ncbi:hypothetical protein ABMA28_008347 [Loxostege sticticalis]|uniref:Uncharacterized protein n=1 Tax=Loxostege sticticalis TaxID=481309 RepID=A0ABD0SJ47_LOXSC
MCEKRTRKIKKGSELTRLREQRRLQRMRRGSTPPSSDESNPSPCPPVVDKVAQNRVILELAWKTVALMHKNRLIQQKIIALQKETSDFVATIMKHPENKRRYVEHVRLYGIPQRLQLQVQNIDKQNIPLKIEPNA